MPISLRSLRLPLRTQQDVVVPVASALYPPGLLIGQLPLPLVPSSDGPTKPAVAPSAAWQQGASVNGLLFEVELWRSDLLTSIFELDEKGLMLGGGLINPLCPPGMKPGGSLERERVS